jgi:hypothetical protein
VNGNLRALVLAVTVAASLAGCSNAREYALLERFFSASRLRDLTAVRGVSSVVFEPREQGTVLSFDIKSVEEVSAGSRVVRVDARVRRPDGQTVREVLLVTISGELITGVAVVPSTPPS